MILSRRQFLGRSAAGLAWGAVGLRGDPLGMPIGCQVYPVREALGKDFDGTLRQLAEIGYRSIEMCSPPGYAKAGFGSLVGIKPTELRSRIHAAGLNCKSCHFNFGELKDSLDDRIAFATDLGLKQMVLASFGVRRDATMDDWVRAAGELNKIAEKIHPSGMRVGYHNHDFEFRQIDGVLVYDKLMETFDPKLIGMQFQVSVISLGYDAATFMNRYPGRFLSLHLQDWSSTEKKQAPVGQGVVDWKKLFAAAKKAGVKNYFVEMNLEAMKESYSYLRTLKV